MKVERLENLTAKLKAKAAKAAAAGKESVVVGFCTSYALFVHENMTASHKSGKQAKFLEGPARRLVNDGTLAAQIRDNVKAGMGVPDALLVAALTVQREAQKVTPVDTGALRASAFTAKESEAASAIEAAADRAEAIKKGSAG